MMETYIVVGLGNPGAQYAKTRHNAGWESLEVLIPLRHSVFWRKKS